jgi:hypothetical protein
VGCRDIERFIKLLRDEWAFIDIDQSVGVVDAVADVLNDHYGYSVREGGTRNRNLTDDGFDSRVWKQSDDANGNASGDNT